MTDTCGIGQLAESASNLRHVLGQSHHGHENPDIVSAGKFQKGVELSV
jgi:hypothetical protein